MSKTVLALDLGTKCGFAVFDLRTADRQDSGTWNLQGGKLDSYGMRFIRLQSQLKHIFTAYPDIGIVVMEEVRQHKGIDAAHIYGGLVATVTNYCAENTIHHAGIPVGTIKKHATGKGNASKEEMIEAAVAKWNIKKLDDNEADALWIASTAVATFGG
jgi:Holliday junction resolvasome RuvABC endonuclease subunit